MHYQINKLSSYKKASNRLRLLEKLRPYLDKNAAMNIYKMMIMPLLTYSGIMCLQHTNSQLYKFKSLENRARKIVDPECEVPKIHNQVFKRGVYDISEMYRQHYMQ